MKYLGIVIHNKRNYFKTQRGKIIENARKMAIIYVTICLRINLSNTFIITDGSITPESRDCLKKIKSDSVSSEAQFNNREAGIPSGPASEFDESSFMESIMIDSVIMILVRYTSSF